jgi:CRP/FNR family transcriptional regulator
VRDLRAGGKECTLKMLMPGGVFCCDAAAFDGTTHPGSAQPMEMSAFCE